MIRIDLTGKTFNRIFVEGYSHQGKKGRSYWNCVCSCGNKKILQGSLIQYGKTRSCGCLRHEARKRNGKLNQHLAASSRLLGDGIAALNALYGRYRTRALKMDLDFKLSIEQFMDLTRQNCYYCGIGPGQTYRTNSTSVSKYTYNGIDRVDNSKGYILDNCVPCCKTCNAAKSNMNKDEFLEWIKRIFSHCYRIKETK